MKSFFRLFACAVILVFALWISGCWRWVAYVLPAQSIESLPKQIQVRPVPLISERRTSWFGGGCAVDVWKLGADAAGRIEEQGIDYLKTLDFQYVSAPTIWASVDGYGLISKIKGSQRCGFSDSSRNYGGYSEAYGWVRSRTRTDPSQYLVLNSRYGGVTYVISLKRAAIMRVSYDG